MQNPGEGGVIVNLRGSVVPPGLYSCLLRTQDFVLGYVRRRPMRDVLPRFARTGTR